MASSVDTPRQGFSSGQARPLAVAMPMRSPVKEPGPLATAIRSISDRLTPQLFSIPSHRGIRVRLWVSPLFW